VLYIDVGGGVVMRGTSGPICLPSSTEPVGSASIAVTDRRRWQAEEECVVLFHGSPCLSSGPLPWNASDRR